MSVIISTFRHMTERAGLGKMTDFFSEVKNLDTEPGKIFLCVKMFILFDVCLVI